MRAILKSLRSLILIASFVFIGLSTVPRNVLAATNTLSSASFIWLFPGNGSSTINVSGVTGSISAISVTFNNLNHTWAADLDFLLVGPGGDRVVLMSDVQGNMDFSGTALTFQDGAPNNFSIDNDDTNGIVSGGTYQVLNNNATSILGDADSDHQIPLNGAESSSLIGAFGGLANSDVNGTWTLYWGDDDSNGNGSLAGWSITIEDGHQNVVDLPPPPPSPLCTAVNFDENAGLRAVAEYDSMEVNCRMLVEDGNYFSWNGGPLTYSAQIGDQSILDLGVMQAVDVFSPTGRTHFEGDVVICLRGTGHLIYLNANRAPRVPEMITVWTTPSFPGFICGTLYEPGTLVLVEHLPE